MASVSTPLRGVQPLRSRQAYPEASARSRRAWVQPSSRRPAGAPVAAAAQQPGTAAAAAAAPSQQPRPADAGPAVRGFDFLVLGSGIAGLSYALKAAEQGTVAVVTKAEAREGSTRWAQGGICAVLDSSDTPESHIYDTIVAGDFENDRRAVEAVCHEGTAAVLELAELGAEFTRAKTGEYHLTKEGGHSHNRIVHATDATGAEIERALLAKANQHPNITMHEHFLATDLITDEVCGIPICLGTDALDMQRHAMVRFVAPVTMLATGGLGQVYPATTNPAVSTGDGQAMAARANARLAGMEFVQFHPTGFAGHTALAGQQTFLISEAVRGEGGHLLTLDGHRFMGQYDTRMELASRDIVARAIYEQMLQRKEPHVLLDISHEPADKILEHFPTIAQRVMEAGFDMTKQPFPVAPVQHYMCGGVQAGLYGETSLAGLFAIGEVACTGLHGANRLASNSLLEGLVFANRAVHSSIAHAERALQFAGGALHHASSQHTFTGSSAAGSLPSSTMAWVAERRKAVQALMGTSAGIVRRQADMHTSQEAMAHIAADVQAVRREHGIVPELVELQNIIGSGAAILDAAAARRNSRGAHFCADYPPDSRDRKAELTRLMQQDTGATADPPASLAPLVPAAQGPSSPLRLGQDGSGRGLLGGRRVVPGPPAKRVGLKRSKTPGRPRSSDSSKTWALEALPRGCPDGCCLGMWESSSAQ